MYYMGGLFAMCHISGLLDTYYMDGLFALCHISGLLDMYYMDGLFAMCYSKPSRLLDDIFYMDGLLAMVCLPHDTSMGGNFNWLYACYADGLLVT